MPRKFYCTYFLNENQESVLTNNAELLLKFIDLLRTACRKPYKSVLKESGQTQETRLYSFNFEPIGESWVSIISFIYQNKSIVETNPILILGLLLDWGKKLYQSFFVPDESRMVGELLLNILRQKDIKYHSGLALNTNESYEEAITLLFRLTEVMKEEVSQILEQSLTYHKKREERFRERRRYPFSQDYHSEIPLPKPDDIFVEKFYREILEKALSCFEARELCYFLPDLVIKLAKEIWLVKEGESEDYSSGIGVEEYFGLANEFKMKYFPASAYKTPTYYLLMYHPSKALQFVIEVINHATEHYKDSSFGKKSNVKEVTMTLNSGDKITKMGEYYTLDNVQRY